MTIVQPARIRNLSVDAARVASVAVVVIFHTLLWQITWNGQTIAVVPWAPGEVLWFISWFLAIIPVFFVAAGFSNAVVVDRATAAGHPYRRFIVERGSRLTGPLTLFTGTFVLLSSVPAWLGMVEPAIGLSRQFAQLLWFLVIYLGLLLASPILVRAFDRWRWWSTLPFLAAAIAIDLSVRAGAPAELGWWNLVAVWGLAHQWGIGYRRGWFVSWSPTRLVVAILGCAAAITALVLVAGYPPAAVAWADVLVANLLPPTLAAVPMGFAQACALGLLERSQIIERLPATALRTLPVLNALAITVYLWHIPVIVVTGGALAGLTLLFPDAAGLLLSPALWLLLTVVAIGIVVPQIARIDQRLMPRIAPGAPGARSSLPSFLVLLASITAVWQCGAVVDPRSPASSVAVAVVVAGMVMVRRTAAAGAVD